MKIKYRYLYQSKESNNQEGFIWAESRADAYAKIRKIGIRPYRVIGDDPTFLRKHLLTIIFAALTFIFAAGFSTLLFYRNAALTAPAFRQQIHGDASLIANAAYNGWTTLFDSPLDRYLAYYARPGLHANPPAPTQAELATFPADCKKPVIHEKDECPEYRQIRNIIAYMHKEMAAYLAAGGTVQDYLALLDERQNQECELREKAAQSVERAPESYRYATWMNMNANLRSKGIAPIDLPRELLSNAN